MNCKGAPRQRARPWSGLWKSATSFRTFAPRECFYFHILTDYTRRTDSPLRRACVNPRFSFLTGLPLERIFRLPGKMSRGRLKHLSDMSSTNAKKLALIASLAVLLAAGILLGLHFSPRSGLSARQELLQFVPSDASSVIFLDLDQLRESPFLAKIYSWAPHPAEDSEYAQFVRDTGFSFERDLKRALIAISNHDRTTNVLTVADGEFDRKKIESFLNRNAQAAQQGKWKVYLLNQSAGGRSLSLAFLSDSRIAIGDSEQFSALLSPAPSHAFRAEWNERFERLD